ncbi:MAG TPA: nuclear transport factor 2 family protein [Candidatus Binatia bacterium]|nr:nuclear transport factor 2 family protein [Candidatus Binatia bacterium]
MSERDETEVAAAHRRFYAAFESLDINRMEGLWRRERYACCVHPGWPPLFGWGAIMQSWQRIFANTAEMRFTLTDLQIRTAGDLAWVSVTEHIETRHATGRSIGVVQATNIFERHDGEWLMVHHHGSPIAHPDGDSPTPLQ